MADEINAFVFSYMRRERIDISKVFPNEGQIDGLPANPRTLDKIKFRKLCNSIESLPEMTEARDLLVYPHRGRYIVIGGNMRLQAYAHLGWSEVPCCVLSEDTPVEKLRQILIQDNNPFGKTDWEMIANEWDAEELDEWGFDVWQDIAQKPGKSKPDNRESDEENSAEQEGSDGIDFLSLMLEDRIYDSNNEFEIPTLSSIASRQAAYCFRLPAGERTSGQRKAFQHIIFMLRITGSRLYGRTLFPCLPEDAPNLLSRTFHFLTQLPWHMVFNRYTRRDGYQGIGKNAERRYMLTSTCPGSFTNTTAWAFRRDMTRSPREDMQTGRNI